MGQDLRRNVASDDFCEIKVSMCHHTRMPWIHQHLHCLSLGSTDILQLHMTRSLESGGTRVRSQEMGPHWQNERYYWWKLKTTPPFQMCFPGGFSLSRQANWGFSIQLKFHLSLSPSADITNCIGFPGEETEGVWHNPRKSSTKHITKWEW